MRWPKFIALLALAATASGQDIEGPEEVPEHRLVRLELTGLEEGDSAIWDAFSLAGHEADGLVVDNGATFVFAGPPGRYRVTATHLVDGQLGQDRQYVVIGPSPGPKPPEPGPEPPGPEPEPTPPQPDVDPIIPGDGLRVMILYETGDVRPGPQQAIFTSAKLRDYLREHTVRDNGVPGYRVWDDDYSASQIAHESDLWVDAYENVKRAAESVPWIVATNGDKQVSAPLPADVDATLELLETVE